MISKTPLITTRPNVPTPRGSRIEPGGMRRFCRRSGAFSMAAGRSIARARSGGSSDGKASTSHRGRADESHEYSGPSPIGLGPIVPQWLSPRQAAEGDDPRQEAALPVGQGEPPGPRPRAEPALGFRFHPCRHRERLRQYSLRYRRLCQKDRRLTCQHLWPFRVRARWFWAGGP